MFSEEMLFCAESEDETVREKVFVDLNLRVICICICFPKSFFNAKY